MSETKDNDGKINGILFKLNVYFLCLFVYKKKNVGQFLHLFNENL